MIRRLIPALAAIAAMVLAVGCGGGSSAPTTPTATEIRSFDGATPADVHPTSTPDATGISRNPIPPVLASEGGRADCTNGWFVHTDEAFSVCYPPDHYAHTWSSAVFESRFSLRLIPGDPVAHTPNALALWLTTTYEQEEECVFQAETVEPDAETELMPYELAGSTGVVCAARASYAVQFKGAVTSPDGALNFHVDAVDDEVLALAMDVLATVQLR